VCSNATFWSETFVLLGLKCSRAANPQAPDEWLQGTVLTSLHTFGRQHISVLDRQSERQRTQTVLVIRPVPR
jgi:hypothetical protein